MARDPVGEIAVTPPTPASLPVALPVVATRTLGSVSIETILLTSCATYDSVQDKTFPQLGDHASLSPTSALICEAEESLYGD